MVSILYQLFYHFTTEVWLVCFLKLSENWLERTGKYGANRVCNLVDPCAVKKSKAEGAKAVTLE